LVNEHPFIHGTLASQSKGEGAFFKAPIENFDSTTLSFFKRDSSFRYEEKKGDWSAIDNNGELSVRLYSFYFDRHPAVHIAFDTGRVVFAYASRNDGADQELVLISLEFSFKNEEDCRQACSLLSADIVCEPEREGKKLMITYTDTSISMTRL